MNAKHGTLIVVEPLDSSQRKGLATALYNWANVVFALLVIGPFVSTVGLRRAHFAVGLTLFAAAYLVATRLNKETK